MTSVVNVRGRNRMELQADPDFIYVGRAVPRAGWPLNYDFANPFTKKEFPISAVANFERCLLAGMALGTYPPIAIHALSWRFRHLTYWKPMADKIATLKGKKLGCWCCDWEPGQEVMTPCHAIILARFCDLLPDHPSTGGL